MSQILRKTLPFVTKNSQSFQQIRFLPRWTYRQPKRVFSPEEYEELENGKIPQKDEEIGNEIEEKAVSNVGKKVYNNKIKWHFSNEQKSKCQQESEVKFKIRPKYDQPLTTKPKRASSDMLETVIDSEGNFVYTKMPNKDSRISLILTELKSKREQEKKDLILLEGKRLIKDALQAGCPSKYIIFSRKDEVEFIKPYLPKFGVQLLKIPYREIQMWSDLSTSPGILGVFKTPNTANYKPKNSLPLTVICENVREPGNLGTILRICAGVGCQNVFLLKGCANLWDTKVLRGAAGAHFRLQIHYSQNWEQVKDSLPENSDIFIADNKTESESTAQVDQVLSKIALIPYFGAHFSSSEHVVLLVGGETYGISEGAYSLAGDMNGVRLNVPLSNDVESLNVGAALGVIAFEIKRQFLAKKSF